MAVEYHDTNMNLKENTIRLKDICKSCKRLAQRRLDSQFPVLSFSI